VATPSIAAPVTGQQTVRPAHFYADLYTFNWNSLEFRLPAVCASAVAFCLSVGIAVGHPGAALIAGGGALTIGFGANQRIADSRVVPMVLATVWMGVATLVGTLAGHRGYAILIASAVAAAVYGFLTVRTAGLAWVGQQAAVTLFVSSAFPQTPRGALERAGLIMLGGLIHMVFTTAALHLMPELRTDLLAIPVSVYQTVHSQRLEFLRRLEIVPKALPAPERGAAMIYAVRLLITVAAATGLYLKLGIQSGYWIPMTALLVQKPAFFETLNRATMRVGGTLAGAWLATLAAAYLHPTHWWLAGLAALFAFWAFATNSVNYGVFSLFLTGYIVFLLSLNAMPSPEIAHRRALCTVAGAIIALIIHIDALRRHRAATEPQSGAPSTRIFQGKMASDEEAGDSEETS
jgi:hypothetical protein